MNEGTQPPYGTRPSQQNQPGQSTQPPHGEQRGGAEPGQQPPAWGQPSQAPYAGQPGQYQAVGQGQPSGVQQPPPGQQLPPYSPYPPQAPYYPQPQYFYPGYYQQYYSGPDNGVAVASLVVACISLAILVFTVGFGAPLSLIMSIVAIVLGVKGKKAVDEGRTRKHRDVAVGGFWTGIGGVLLSLLAIAGWVLFFVFVASGSEADPGDLASLASLPRA